VELNLPMKCLRDDCIDVFQNFHFFPPTSTALAPLPRYGTACTDLVYPRASVWFHLGVPRGNFSTKGCQEQRATTDSARPNHESVDRREGRVPGRPKRIFRRDEILRLRDLERMSWRAISAALRIPVTTAVDAYRTENVSPSEATGDRNDSTSVVASEPFAIDRNPYANAK
jgi:hypothetical protein